MAISSLPFPFFVKDNFLKDFDSVQREFRSLIDLIPDWKAEYGVAYANQCRLNSPIMLCFGKEDEHSFEKLSGLASNLPHISDFFRLVSQEGFWEFFPELRKLKIFTPEQQISIIDILARRLCVRVSLKITRSASGSGIAIHRDSLDKVCALLLYFGYSDGIAREGGGTQIYKKIGRLKINDHDWFTHDDFDLILDVSPKENRLFGFVRTANSWHGVKPIELHYVPVNKVYREALQINLVRHRRYTPLVQTILNLRKWLFNFLR